MKVVALDLSDHGATLVECRQRFGGVAVRAVGYEPLPEGAVQRGTIQDVNAVNTAVRTAAAKATPTEIQLGSVYVALPESLVFTHVFSFPRELRDNEIEDAIRVQFSEYIPHDIESAAYDWKVVQESDQTQMILVGACERSLVEKYTALGQLLECELQSVDIESASVARAVLPPAKDLEAHLLIDIGANVASFSIFDERGLQSTTVLETGGALITKMIAEKTGLSRAEAEELKKNLNVAAPNQQQEEAYAAVRDCCHSIVEEAKRTIQFYEGSRRKEVKGVTLCGGTALVQGIDEYIGKQMALPVDRANVARYIRQSELLEQTSQPLLHFANAVGLCIGVLEKKQHPKRFNLLRYIN